MWLDELIHAVYEDLVEYVEWQKYQSRVSEALLPSERANGDGEEEDGDHHRKFDMAPVEAPSAGDWLRRGALCERLQQLDDAEKCYRMCVEQGFNAGAWLGLG